MQYIDQAKAYSDFDDFIDEIHAPIEIMGMRYTPSIVLKEIDQTAYYCEFDNWLDHNDLTTNEEEADKEEEC